MTSPAGKHAVVTGGGTGIGAAVVSILAERGCRVTAVCPPGGEESGAAVAAASPRGAVAVASCDVSDAAALRDMVDAARNMFGPIDIAVANAGIATASPTTNGVDATFGEVIATDVHGVHNLFALTVPSMVERQWGRLIATSSISGYRYGWENHAAYCAAKAAVSGLVRTYAVEFAAGGVTANAVAPGIARTAQSLDEVNSLGAEGLDAVARLIPVGYVAEPRDVAGVYAFLASDDAKYVTGQTIIVDGGLGVVEPN
ncbi:MAG TPA: SDR family oxidoreductase [Mycobacterium sp.]|nr:SDR family oxidoreductase [Mycobacterium sp.]